MAIKQKKKKLSDSPKDLPTPAAPYKGPVHVSNLAPIVPLTDAQKAFWNAFDAGSPCIMLHGVAGTGKTFIAMYKALQDTLMVPKRRIILMRSAVPTRDIGFLPGAEAEKMAAYQLPYGDMCARLVQHPNGFTKLLEQRTIEFWSTSFIRGVTLDDTTVIVDECQNMTDMELHSIMTRFGARSRVVWCGDFRQTDTMKASGAQSGSGLRPFMDTLNRMPKKFITQIEFGVDDIVRSPLVKEYLIARMATEDRRKAA